MGYYDRVGKYVDINPDHKYVVFASDRSERYVMVDFSEVEKAYQLIKELKGNADRTRD